MNLFKKLLLKLAHHTFSKEEIQTMKNIPTPEEARNNIRKKIIETNEIIIKNGLNSSCFSPYLFKNSRESVLKNPDPYSNDVYNIAKNTTEEEVEKAISEYEKNRHSYSSNGGDNRTRGSRSRRSSRRGGHYDSDITNPANPSNFHNFD